MEIVRPGMWATGRAEQSPYPLGFEVSCGQYVHDVFMCVNGVIIFPPGPLRMPRGDF